LEKVDDLDLVEFLIDENITFSFPPGYWKQDPHPSSGQVVDCYHRAKDKCFMEQIAVHRSDLITAPTPLKQWTVSVPVSNDNKNPASRDISLRAILAQHKPNMHTLWELATSDAREQAVQPKQTLRHRIYTNAKTALLHVVSLVSSVCPPQQNTILQKQAH
jgi:hypothetical protein